MIYLNNTTSAQTINIPRNTLIAPNIESKYQKGYNDGFAMGRTAGIQEQKSLLTATAITENGDYVREDGWSGLSVNITTAISATLGDGSFSANGSYSASTDNLDGYSAITVNLDTASTYNSGYTSGHTDGVNEEKAKLSATTFTANTAITLNDGGFSAVTVNVPQTGTSIPLTSITITANTAITESEKAYTGITVNVPQTGYTQQDLDDAYASGVTIGENIIIATFSSATATTNGVYGSSAHPLSSITVNTPVPTGTSIEGNKNIYVGSLTNTEFYVYPTKDNVVVTEIVENKKFTIEVTGITSDKFVFLGYLRDTSITSRYEGYSIFYKTGEFFIDSAFDYYPYTATTSSNTLTIELEYACFQWVGNGDGNNYDTISGLTMMINPLVSSTEAVVYMSNYIQYIYPSQYGVEYLRGVIVNCEDYVNSARTESYASGYSSGYTSGETDGFNSGYTSGETHQKSLLISTAITENGTYTSENGYSAVTVNISTGEYASGYTQGMKDALEDSFYGAYYPVDNILNKSYYTVFPTLEEGQKLYFDIVVYTAQNNTLLGNNQGNLFLSMESYDGVYLRVADSNGLSGATLHTYWLAYSRPGQTPFSRSVSRVCGEVSVTSGECKTALDTGGAWLEEITTSGDFSLQYPVTFNTNCASGLVLNSLVYKDVQTNKTLHHFKLNPETLEMEDYFNDNTVAPTYDYNGNLVSGVLEPRQFRF